MQQVGCPMSQQGVTLHLSESDSTTKLATLDGLASHRVDGTSGSHLNTPTQSAEHSVQLMQLSTAYSLQHLASMYSTMYYKLALLPLANIMTAGNFSSIHSCEIMHWQHDPALLQSVCDLCID